MSSTGLFVLDGVIRKAGTNDILIRQGKVLYLAVAAGMRVGILGGTDKEHDDWFLRSQYLIKHPDLFEERRSDGPTIEQRRLAQITRARARGSSVEFVVEPNPAVAAYLMDKGVPVLLFMPPRYMHPDFRPDASRESSPWDTLVSTVDYQEALRVNDSRTEMDPE